MKEIKKRWLSDTPVFFKKLIHAGIVVGLVGGAFNYVSCNSFSWCGASYNRRNCCYNFKAY